MLCLKQGGMQAKVDPAWFATCGALFLKPTLNLIAPPVVVTLGERAYKNVCQAYRLHAQRFRLAVESDAIELSSGSLLVPVYHCGARIMNTHRRLEDQKRDWLRVRVALAQRPRGAH
ncbi:MAG: hypothetical protein LAO79_19940 [Acidobacteriia bacterium]|nr:hypothetical protein [Terriglobia bacterium]